VAGLRNRRGTLLPLILLANLSVPVLCAQSATDVQPDPNVAVAVEVAIPNHLQDGQELQMPTRKLIKFGEKLFTAVWTIQEGADGP
jgi:hypothetical protein